MTVSSSTARRVVAAIRPCRIVTVGGFLLAGLWAGQADASCGNWLADHADSPAVVDDPTAPIASHEAPPFEAPCQGPGCRRSRQDLPVLPPGPNRHLDGPERWCRLADELLVRPTVFSSLPPEADVVCVDGFRPSIDRPPRV